MIKKNHRRIIWTHVRIYTEGKFLIFFFWKRPKALSTLGTNTKFRQRQNVCCECGQQAIKKLGAEGGGGRGVVAKVGVKNYWRNEISRRVEGSEWKGWSLELGKSEITFFGGDSRWSKQLKKALGLKSKACSLVIITREMLLKWSILQCIKV